LPQPLPARLEARGATAANITLNWSSTAVIQDELGETLVMDIESREWLFSLSRAITDRITLRVNVPYRSYHAGVLDGVADAWHSLASLPTGDRDLLPRNELLLDYRRDGEAKLQLQQSVGGIGDATIDGGWQLHASHESASALWWTVKLPTGDSDKLTGSESIGSSLGVAHERRVSSRWWLHANTSATYLAPGNILPEQQLHWVWSGTLGFHYRYSSALTLSLQFDGHTEAFGDSKLRALSNPWIVVVGGEYRWPSNWLLQIGIGEDLTVQTSPDVDFIFSLRKAWR